MPGYVWDGSNWQTLKSIYAWDGDSWVSIKNGYAWDGSNWRPIFSSGTFFPLLRQPGQTGALTRRSVGLAIELFRGSTASGSYAYQFQYAVGEQTNWSNQTGTNNSGTLTGATTTTNYTTDSSDLTLLENIAISGNNIGILDDIDTYRTQEAKNMYMRARVIRSGETQFTQNIIIHKRETQNSGSTLTLRRASTGLTYTLTGDPTTDRQPYVGDTIFWTPNFSNTTTGGITNDRRPDYYWFSFDGNSGPNYRNSILSDPTNPRNPINARSYTIQSSDLGGPIVCTMRGINTNPNESVTQTGTVFISTRDVSDGTLTAPQNLVLSYQSLSLRGQWDAAGGGNDSTITYTWYLERSIGGGSYTQVASGNTTNLFFTSAQTTPGNYRFYVSAAQTGNPSVTSGFSNVFALTAPAAFNVTIQNVTNTETYRPSIFTVSAPVLDTLVLNRWNWTWNVSTFTGPVYRQVGANGSTITGPQTPNTFAVQNWLSTLTRPDSSTVSITRTVPNDFWDILSNGNHTETVTANNNQRNFVRISWTKPTGTSAVSYRVRWNAYIPSGAVNQIAYSGNVVVGDVTSIDVENTYNVNGAWVDGSNVLVTSVTAYNGENATGVEQSGTIPPFNVNGADGTTSWSRCDVIGTRQSSRTDFLQLENPTRGTLTVTGTYEPNEVLSIAEGSGWSPSYSSTAWTKSYSWTRSGTVSPVNAGTSATVTTATNSPGDRYSVGVTVTYKGTSYGTSFGSMQPSGATIVPKAPVFSLVDNLNQTFSVPGSFISAVGANSYYGTYSGASSGTVSQTAIGTTFTSPTVNTGNINVTLNSRATVNLVWPTTQNGVVINSNNSTTNSVTIAQPPQAQGQRRFLSSIYNVVPGTIFYVSSNGYLGLQSTTVGSSFTPPSNGNWLNIAAADLVTQYVYSRADAGGLWVRYRGNRFNNTSAILEYQAYYPYNTSSVYVLFLENSIPDYVVNNAYYNFGTISRTWTQSVADTSSFTQLIGTGSMVLRSVTAGTADDGVYQFTVTAPAIPMNPNPTVTRTAGGFTFNITDQGSGTFDAGASYAGLVISGTANTPTINSFSGLVTVTGMTASSFATVRIAKAKSGYESTTIEVTGQALAGSPPQQVAAPSLSATGTADGSGTVRRIQSGGTVSGSAGTYNNQQSISSGILTILSNSYTGADSNWTSAGSIGTSVPISDGAASSSANMYRWRDRVVGTDGSTVDFYSSVIYRAVYAPPAGVSQNAGLTTTTQIGVNYTGYAAQRIYRFRDSVQIDFFTPATSGQATTTFTGLSAGTPYNLQLFGGNNEGYLSVNSSGGTFSTNGANLVTPTILSASQSTAGGALTVTVSGGGPAYQIWWQSTADTPTVSGFDASSSSTTIVDASGPGSAGTWYVSARSVSNVNNTGVGPSATISAWSPTRAFTVSGGGGGNPPGTPTITGNNTLPLGGTFSWTFTGGTAPFTYSVFCSGPSGTVFTTSNQYTWGSASFRPAYDGTGGTNGTGWQGAGNYQISVSVRDSLGLTSSAGSGSQAMS